MLSNLLLIVVQFAAAFLGAPHVMGFIPISGDLRTFAHAAVFAVIVWIVGLVAAQILKDIQQRSVASLSAALVLALIGAALIVFLPQVVNAIPLKFPQLYVPLLGAILGYFMRR